MTNLHSWTPSQPDTFAHRARIRQDIIDFCQRMASQIDSTHTPFFITTSIRPIRARRPSSELLCYTATTSYNKFYQVLCAQLVSNYTRKSKLSLLPVTFDFIDDNSSKGRAVHTMIEMPHIHSIVFIRNEQLSKFKELSKDNFACFARYQKRGSILSSIESLDIKSICDLLGALDYASKLLESPMANKEMLYNFNPKGLQSMFKKPSFEANNQHLQ